MKILLKSFDHPKIIYIDETAISLAPKNMKTEIVNIDEKFNCIIY